MAPTLTTLLGFVALLAAPALAQTTVLNITVPIPYKDLVASAVSADATATEYVVGCSNKDTCEIPAGAKLKYGPSTVEFAMSQTFGEPKTTNTNIFGCNNPVSGTAVCTRTQIAIVGTVTNSTANAATLSTEMATWAHAVTVTAGLANMTPKPTSASAGGSNGAGGAAPTSTTGQGAAPRMTGGAAMAVGMVAVVGGVMFA